MGFTLQQDTICAIATPVGDGGIGIIKLSGSDSLDIVLKLFKPRRPTGSFKSHRLYYGTLVDPSNGRTIDEVLMSYMAAPTSYTCEDVVEINCHSGYAVLNRVLELVLETGARLAEPGEFTRRAFLNGRIDLSQAEAVIDIIRSRSEQSLLLAGSHLQGALRANIESLRDALLQIHAEIEAHIDFADDIEDESPDNPFLLVRFRDEIVGPLQKALSSYESGRIIREGLTLALVGKPNVGKSSLLNGLLGRDRAIVTAIPGTTRDVIEDSFILSGVQVRILDTAGIRHEPDEIESMGIERTIKSVADADLILWLMDRSAPLSPEDDAVHRAIASARYLPILNKSDLPPAILPADVAAHFNCNAPILELSTKVASDIDRLRGFLSETFLNHPLETNRSMIVSNLRHKECLERALTSSRQACSLLAAHSDFELVSIELLSARREMESILGLECDDELLDRIFSNFCIGK
jgi:tRNA modification GTPase